MRLRGVRVVEVSVADDCVVDRAAAVVVVDDVAVVGVVVFPVSGQGVDAVGLRGRGRRGRNRRSGVLGSSGLLPAAPFSLTALRPFASLLAVRPAR